MATQSRIGWRPYVNPFTPEDPGTPNTIDQDVTNFILASGISDSVQTSAIETLVSDLKAYGLWTKMKAIYPFVGGSAASHKFNLKDPRDLDAAYRLVFYGGMTHTNLGMVSNYTTSYADTRLTPSTTLSSLFSQHVSVYSQTSAATPANNINSIGEWQDGTRSMVMKIRNLSNVFSWEVGNSSVSTTNINGQGFYLGSVVANNSIKLYKNNVNVATNTNVFSGSLPSQLQPIGKNENKTFSFSSIGEGLTDTEASNFYISVQKFQTTLGRHVGTPYVSDPDAITFLMAAGITDGTQAAAINTLVIRMKADGLWTKMKAIYPFVGGSATSHKFNLKDPRDLDAAYRLVFNGGSIHNSTGYVPNLNSYADTKLNPSTVLNIDSIHFSYYSRTNLMVNNYDMGVTISSVPVLSLTAALRWGDGVTYYSMGFNPTEVNKIQTSTDKNFIFNKITTSASLFENTTKTTTSVTNRSGLPNGNFFIAARNLDGTAQQSPQRNCAFSSIGDGLTDAEVAAFYNAVQAFQTTLGRQVNIPAVSDTDAQSFLNVANITSFQQASAVNKLVVDLKAAGVWSKMKAIYPFVGGSATSHKWNLKDPRDLDVAYRLVFNGGWTHTSTGAKPNGTTGYADTFLNEYSKLTSGDNHISAYVNTNEVNSGYPYVIGTYNPVNNRGLAIRTFGSDNILRFYNKNNVDVSNTSANSTGFWLNIAKSNRFIGLKNSTKIIDTIPDNAIVNGMISLACVRWTDIGATQFSSQQQVFASIGDGLTDAEATAFYTAVQTYQTSLGRHVATPVYNNGLVLSLDAGSANSYPGTGTTWFDLVAGNNGTLVNGPTYDSTNGGSILFDGVNDRISTFPTQFPNNGSKTIDVWFKTTSTVRQGLCGTRDALSTGWVFTINRTTSGRLTYFHTGSGVAEFAAGITTNTWYNAVATHDSTTGLVKIYLNGSLIGSSNVGVIYSSSFNGVIGDEDSTVPSTPFKGNIPKVNIYNKVLTDTEILSNFNSTRGRFGL